VKYDEFLRSLEERAGISDRTEAERTAVAVLEVLADRLTGDEAHDLISQLPYQLKKRVRPTLAAMRMTPEEFVERVADRRGLRLNLTRSS
jgi:uncharacterized protein (DUF2267 family)